MPCVHGVLHVVGPTMYWGWTACCRTACIRNATNARCHMQHAGGRPRCLTACCRTVLLVCYKVHVATCTRSPAQCTCPRT